MTETYWQRRYRLDPEYAERKREQAKAWRAQNREAYRESQRKAASRRRAEDPEWVERERKRLRALRTAPGARERATEISRNWANANRDRYRSNGANSQARRRARLRAVDVETIDRRVVYERDGGRCHICRRRVAASRFHLDHVVPLAKGGSHTYENVKVAHPRCNLRKAAALLG